MKKSLEMELRQFAGHSRNRRTALVAAFAASMVICCLFTDCSLLPTRDGFMNVAGVVKYQTNFPKELASYSAYGTAPEDSKHYKEGDPVVILGNDDYMEAYGYSFHFWNTKVDGSGTDYRPGTTVGMPFETLNLYAKWEWGSFGYVFYDANGASSGSVPIDTGTYNGQYATIKANTGNLSKIYSVFDGWTYSKDGSGSFYRPGDTTYIYYSSSGDLTLYADWAPVIDTNSSTWYPVSVSPTVPRRAFRTAVTPGQTYHVQWDDSYNGTGTYTLDAYVDICHPNGSRYLSNVDSGYTSPQSITIPAGETSLIVIAHASYSGYTGTVAVHVY